MTTCTYVDICSGVHATPDLARRDAVGRATPEEAAWLRHPDHLDEWRDQLIDLITRSQVDITAARAAVVQARDGNRAAYCKALKDHARRSAGATSFRQMCEVRLRECKRLQRARDDAADAETRAAIAARIRRLEAQVGALLDMVDEAHGTVAS